MRLESSGLAWIPFAVRASGLTAALLCAWMWLFGAGLIDDAYITFRYAANLAAGLGPVYNAGERVEGATSVLWTALLGLAALATARIEWVASFLAALGALAVAGCVMAAAGGANGPVGRRGILALGLATVSLPAFFFWAGSGMEHTSYAALVAGTLCFAHRDLGEDGLSPVTAALLCLALLLRLEAVVLAAWLGFFFSVRHGRLDAHWWRRIALPMAAAGSLLLLVVAARLAYYGDLVPNTFHAKVGFALGERVQGGSVYVLRGLLAHAPLVGLTLVLARRTARRRGGLGAGRLLFVGWLGLDLLCIVSLGGDHFPMFRFLVPWMAVLLVWLAMEWRDLAASGTPGSLRTLGRVLLATVVLSLAFDGERAHTEPRLAKSWSLVGQWLRENTVPRTLVATNVVGAIGFYSERPVLDLLGLVDRRIAREGALYEHAAPGHARFHTDYVFERRPDLVVYQTSAVAMEPSTPFTPVDRIYKRWAYALYDFVRDPRCAERYQHVSVPLPDGTFIEMQKRMGFPLRARYLTSDPAPAAPVGERLAALPGPPRPGAALRTVGLRPGGGP